MTTYSKERNLNPIHTIGLTPKKLTGRCPDTPPTTIVDQHPLISDSIFAGWVENDAKIIKVANMNQSNIL